MKVNHILSFNRCSIMFRFSRGKTRIQDLFIHVTSILSLSIEVIDYGWLFLHTTKVSLVGVFSSYVALCLCMPESCRASMGMICGLLTASSHMQHIPDPRSLFKATRETAGASRCLEERRVIAFSTTGDFLECGSGEMDGRRRGSSSSGSEGQ